ncbi:MAG: PaaR repeat-containing protein [Deltaproteobacteria bacterium]|nr:PaaR repeat-containing protein [Deltaproteobacteria bacterium]
MFPAARKGDPVTHDMLVPSGVIGPPLTGPCPMGIVLIEFLPAAHVNCTVICSGAITGGIVHPPPPPGVPPPPIVKGSMTVFIHNMPAARWAPSGDIGACGVFLGDPKLAAMRTVLIGG